MTVADLRLLLFSLPEDMMVYIPIDEDNNCFPVCREVSEIEAVQTEDGTEMTVFILRPCTHERDDLPINTKTYPN